MELFTITLISVALAMDAMAVSLALGTSGEVARLRGELRVVFHFGVFQAGMTALGWLAGETVVQYVEGFDHWIAFGLLAYVAIDLIRSGLGKVQRGPKGDPSRGTTLLMLSLATSLDALAVGLSVAFLKVPILLSVAMIGLTTVLVSSIGFLAGARLGATFGKRMEIVGGLILLAIGVRVVVSHLWA